MIAHPFPPYGVFSGRYRTLGDDEDAVMPHWMPDADLEERVRTFKKWRNKQLKEISEFLWPRYDRVNRDWIGGASSFALEATTAEINAIIDEFRSGVFEQLRKPSTKLMASDMKDHLFHFQIEDDVKRPSGETIRQYDKTLSDSEYENIRIVIDNAIGGGVGPARKVTGLFWLKTELVRPRPYQSAMLVDRDDFTCEIAHTSFHSSIISGHCIQGMMLGCAVLEDWLNNEIDYSEDRADALAQYMVDWGDRRVFAGVHYPTDNIASWTLAMALIPHIFGHVDIITEFARTAIVERSRVFKLVDTRYRTIDALKPAVDYLDSWVPKSIAATS